MTSEGLEEGEEERAPNKLVSRLERTPGPPGKNKEVGAGSREAPQSIVGHTYTGLWISAQLH